MPAKNYEEYDVKKKLLMNFLKYLVNFYIISFFLTILNVHFHIKLQILFNTYSLKVNFFKIYH